MSHPRQGGVRRKTHASFFSGVGGMDIGLERAGWHTVSLSEIEPYPCAVLSERWPDVPNLGDITRIVDVPDATLWTGGFPCQDLSVAGQRKGFTGERSVLAFTFLDLVERHRPEAFILENVPGLLSSNAGRDFGRLLREVGDLGYGWAYRVLDAQWFGVPQRRRRVFILALDLDRHPDPDSAAEVLAIGTSCRRDHQAERASWSSAAGRVGQGASVAGTYTAGAHPGSYNGQDAYTNHLVYGAPPDAAGVRAPDGMAGRVDDLQPTAIAQNQRGEVRLNKYVHGSLGQGGGHPGSNGYPAVFIKGKRAMNPEDFETWRDDHVSPTLNGFDVGDTRATTLVADTLNSGGNAGGFRTEPGAHLAFGSSGPEDDLLPLGLDSNRYRAIGNGVASPVAEWIGLRLADYLDGRRAGV